MATDNPYASPASLYEGRTYWQGWRILATAGSGLVGGVSFGFGLFAVVVMGYVLWTDQANVTIGKMITACMMYLGVGAAWIVAAWCYWNRRYRRGLAACALGIVLPAVLFAIFGV